MKAKQKSFISNSNSKNLYYRSNSSNKSKISQLQLSKINNSLTDLIPPITFTMPRKKNTSHMGYLITKEELYEENFQLKNSLKKAKKELEEAKKNLFKKGLELEKKEKIINDCNKENVTEGEREINLHKAKESTLLTLCRKKYNEMKSNYEKECKQNEMLKMNIKLTKLKEYHTQIAIFQKEMEKLRLLYINSQNNLTKVMNELNNMKEFKNEYINQHSLINIMKKKYEDLTENIKSLQEENTFLKNEIEKNQMMQKKLKQRNIKLKISNEKYMKMKKMQEGTYLVNKNNIVKINSLQKDLKEYKDLYEKQNYEYQKLTSNNNKKGGNISNSDLLSAERLGFINSKVIETKVENNQDQLYKSLFNNEKLKTNIYEIYFREHGIDFQKLLKQKGYDGIIRKEFILKHKSSTNLHSENNSQNTKCATSVGNKENFEQSKKLNNTQSNLENNLITSKNSKNLNLKRSFTQEQLRDSNEENFEVQNNNDMTENHIIMTDSQNSEFYLQEQFKKTPQMLSLIQVFIINFEANHVTKEEFINKIKEISAMFDNKEETTKEEFLEPFINLFINLMQVTNDKDISEIKEFFVYLIDETEGDSNKFFYELIDIANNIFDYTLIENEEEILNFFAKELLPYKEKLEENLKNYQNNLITFDSLKKLFEELKINLGEEYYQYLLYKMKENVRGKNSIFELNSKIILDILEGNINFNHTNNFKNLSVNMNKDINNLVKEENESEENKINLQIGLIFKQLKQALSNNKTNFEDECKSIIHNLDVENKTIKGIDKEDFFKIFKKYNIQIAEKTKNSIFELFKFENSSLENKENNTTLIDYDRVLIQFKN